MIVYLVTNKINGKQYVGQTIGAAEKRWSKHGKLYSKRNSYFTNAILKYGRNKFSVEVLHECSTKEEMDFVETFYISLLNTVRPKGYNLTTGGEGTPGHTVSKVGILRMIKSHLGKKRTEESKKKQSESLKKAYAERRHVRVGLGRAAHNRGCRQSHCKHGHVFIPLKSGGGCTECHRLREEIRRLDRRLGDSKWAQKA